MITAASVVGTAMRPGGPTLAQRAQSVPRLVRATLDGTYSGTTVGRLALVAAAVAYVVSPVDLLPEVLLPVLGAADDAVVITWAVRVLVEETDRFLAWELGQGLRRLPEPSGLPTRPSARPTGLGQAASGALGALGGSSASATTAASGAAGARRVELPDEVRAAATSYVLESVRRRLER